MQGTTNLTMIISLIRTRLLQLEYKISLIWGYGRLSKRASIAEAIHDVKLMKS